MIKWAFTTFLLLIANLSFCQSNASFNKLISETNKYLDSYSELNPFHEYYALTEFEFTDKEHNELIKEANNDTNLIKNDSIEVLFLIYYMQNKIIENLHDIIENPEFHKNDITQLLHLGSLQIVKSEDNKLYNFSLNEKSGGSYLSRISFMYFTDINPSISSSDSYKYKSESTDPFLIFNGDGFTSIHSIQTKEGTKYVLSAHTRTCGSCYESSMMLVQFIDGAFKQEFYYRVSSRSWESGVFYDTESQTINVEYKTDDLTTYCNCTNEIEEEEKRGSFYDNESKRVKCHCRFVFNGVYFELVKEGWEAVTE